MESRAARYASRTAPAEAIRLVIVLLACIPAIQPLLGRGLQDGTYDAAYHLYRLLDFDHTVRAGNLLPWIAPHLALDYGYATFTFYAPLSLYVGEAFRLLGLGYIASLKASFVVAMLASALGTYLLARDLFGWRSAIAAALIYVYVPYRLLDVYVNGDLAEVLAQAALPFAFWGIWRVVQRPGIGSSVAAGIAIAALILAHTITAMFAAPLLLGFLAVLLVRRVSLDTITSIVASVVLGLALSSVYWLPVVLQLGDVNTVALTTGQNDFHREFLPLHQLFQHQWAYDYRLLPEIGSRYNLGLAQASLTVLALFWVVIARPARSALLLGSAFAASVLLWMQQSGSAILWEHLPLVHFVQYPNRLCTYIGLLCALLFGAFVARPGERSLGLVRRILGRSTLVVLGTGLECAVVALFVWASLASLPRQHATLQESEVNLPTVWRKEHESHLVVGNAQGDFLPASVGTTFFENSIVPASQAPDSSSAQLTAIWSDPLTLEARSEAALPTTVFFDRLNYPGWRATIDGNPTEISSVPPRQVMRITVPTGQHEVRISDPGTGVDQIGAWISLGALIVVAILIVQPGRNGWPRRLTLVVSAVSLATVGLASQVRPPRQLESGVNFGDSVRLVGSRIDRVPGSQEGVIDVTLTWEALRSPLPDCVVHLALRDASGQIVAHRDKAPLFGLRPCSQWRAGEIVRDHQQIRLPPGVATGRYQLTVGLTLNGETALPVVDDSVSSTASHAVQPALADTATTLLGAVNAPAPPTPAALPGSVPIGATIGDFFSLDAARVQAIPADQRAISQLADRRYVARITPGESLKVDLLLRSLSDVPEDYAVFVHLLDTRQRLVAQRDNFPDHENFPTTVWFPGDRLVDGYQIGTSPRLTPGVYSIGVGMYTRHDLKTLPVLGNRSGGYQVIIGHVKVTSHDHVYGYPRDVSPREAVFGRQIALVGCRIHPRARARRDSIVVDLEWRAHHQPTADYTVFVHVLDSHGHLVAQHDAQPLAGTFPTSDWDAGDTVYDTVSIPLPPMLAAGTYRIEAGLYQLATGVRLNLPNGDDAIQIGAIDGDVAS